MFRNIVNFIKDEKFRVNVIDNKVNIVNYEQIVILEEEKIIINSRNKKVIVRGQNLSITKLLDNELLIIGQIKILEFEDI